MAVVLITGSAGLIGSEASRFFHEKGYNIVGIDNNFRQEFFGAEASTEPMRHILETTLPRYKHYSTDIRDEAATGKIFAEYGSDIEVVIHTAAQPSHDWAAGKPFVDFTVNAIGTLTMLEAARKYCPKAVFIFTSTNKVYGDTPNRLPLVELDTRWEIAENHPYKNGIDESMSIDNSKHSLFGVSKASADLLVQEYGKYFNMKTGIFRGGCLTGGGHAGTQLHGFLSYLMKCCITGKKYNIFGYKGKQVRDNIHSFDLVNCFYNYVKSPRCGEVYNMGGSRFSNCSMMEAIALCERVAGKKMNAVYHDENRIGDHIWYISDVAKFEKHYPQWKLTWNLERIAVDIFEQTVRKGAV
jgi:CDP-paratose 2-epimerase